MKGFVYSVLDNDLVRLSLRYEMSDYFMLDSWLHIDLEESVEFLSRPRSPITILNYRITQENFYEIFGLKESQDFCNAE